MNDFTQEEEQRGLLASPAFWWGGVLSLAVWSAGYLIWKAVTQ
jgi:hypothetical protein